MIVQVNMLLNAPAGHAKSILVIKQIVLTVWAAPSWWQLLIVSLSVGLCLYVGASFN